ncbi:hypothetical protein DFH28DRAFT_1057331 [Melampsora americana]|nr:hypothetical protein DFH28DRAFT_1059262 [Melampsora americana]KAH9815452.1 hypothetical protein DFH28DRAFT_1057331 [Melampsora americana]
MIRVSQYSIPHGTIVTVAHLYYTNIFLCVGLQDLSTVLPSRGRGTVLPSRGRGTVLPSRGRGTAPPRPRPTVLSAVSQGKQRRMSFSSDDWVPDASTEGDSPSSANSDLEELVGLEESVGAGMESDGENEEVDTSMTVSGSSGNKVGDTSTSGDEGSDDGARAAIMRMLRTQEKDNTAHVNDHNYQDLHQKFNDLTQLVLQLVSNPPGVPAKNQTPNIKKRQGHGTTFRARIRSHAWTMMGLKEDDEIPPSATPAQQSSWKIHTSKKDMLLPCQIDREVANGLTSSANDPRFPFKGGPGGEHSNPQILLIMWTMMSRVGVASFRPIWEDSMTSPQNKFLWTLATSTFIRLVKVGEYDDITSEDAKFDVVFKALREHARCTLKRSFRQTNEWSQAKIRAHRKAGVRAARLRALKLRRNKIAIKNKVTSMCDVIDHCCSEDETDMETVSNDSPKKLYNVKKFQWRNPRVGALLLKLEAYDDRQRKENPKHRVGCQPRHRVRDKCLISTSKAPSGLPSDCYDPEWLENLRTNHPDEYDELQADPTPVLDDLEKSADILLKI